MGRTRCFIFLMLCLMFCGLASANDYQMRYNAQTGRGDWVLDTSTSLTVGGTITAQSGIFTGPGESEFENVLVNGTLTVSGTSTLTGDVTLDGTLYLSDGSAVTGSADLGKWSDIDGGIYYPENVSVDGVLYANGGAEVLSDFAIYGATGLLIGTTTRTADLTVGVGTADHIDGDGDVHISGDLEVDGNIYIDGFIYLRGTVM